MSEFNVLERTRKVRGKSTNDGGKADGTGLPGYVQSECVLKHATRTTHCERVLVLGLVRADVLFTRR